MSILIPLKMEKISTEIFAYFSSGLQLVDFQPIVAGN